MKYTKLKTTHLHYLQKFNYIFLFIRSFLSLFCIYFSLQIFFVLSNTFPATIGRSGDEENVSFYFYIITFLLFLIFFTCDRKKYQMLLFSFILCSFLCLFLFQFSCAWDVDRKKMSTANPPGFSNIRFDIFQTRPKLPRKIITDHFGKII